jgi:hypothetical protein
MKYIIKIEDFKLNEKFNKTLEKYSGYRMYWIVPLEPSKLRIALRKIGIKEEDIPLWIEDFKVQNFGDANRVCIFKVIDRDEYISNEYWDYNIKYKYQDGDKFMGEITVEDWEVAADKYNL